MADYAALLLASKIVYGELRCSCGVSDVDVESFVRRASVAVFTVRRVEMPEVGVSLVNT